ncbi:hypothetical protein ECFRIK2001_5453, partial [Escherichia coli FRIK2001]
SLADQF